MCYQVWTSKAALLVQNGSKELVKLWGEDALLSWPGALEPVIHERDVHMAKTIWTAASGKRKPVLCSHAPEVARHSMLFLPSYNLPAQAADEGIYDRGI